MSHGETFPPAVAAEPSAEQRAFLRDRLQAAAALAAKYAGEAGREPPSPAALDRVYDAWRASPVAGREPAAAVLDALGAALGEHLARLSGLAWIVVEDEEGGDLAVYGAAGEMLIYPFQAVARRHEAGEPLALARLVADVAARWHDLSEAWRNDD